MKYFLESKRSKAILGIGVLAIGIGAISKKVISYPTGGCIKGGQEMTFHLDKHILNKPVDELNPIGKYICFTKLYL